MEEKRRVTVELSEKEWNGLRDLARKEGKEVNELMKELAQKYLRRLMPTLTLQQHRE